MPSGRTHDRVTLWSLPLVAGLTYSYTRHSSLTLLVSGGFLFSGLMFGPDLDIRSRQYLRWGWMRWLWLPYQKTLRHRSWFSHGPVIGTIIRILYLALWVTIGGTLSLWAGQQLGLVNWGWPEVGIKLERSLLSYPEEWLALFIGLELGAMSHSLSDGIGSTYKRWQKHKWKALFSSGKRKKKHDNIVHKATAKSKK